MVKVAKKINSDKYFETEGVIYSLWFGKRSRLRQQHGLQNTTLTSLFYKYIYSKVIFVYFYENDFQNKSIDVIFTFLNQ
jgi:hypothetical protein